MGSLPVPWRCAIYSRNGAARQARPSDAPPHNQEYVWPAAASCRGARFAFRHGAKAPNMAGRKPRNAPAWQPDRPRHRRHLHRLRPASRRHRRISLYKCLTTPQDPSVGGARGPRRADRARPASRSPTSARSCTARRWSPTRSSSGAARGSACSPRRASATSSKWAPSSATTSTTCSSSFPDPLVPRRHRLEIGERMDRDGARDRAARSGRGARRGARSSSMTASRRSRSASCTPTPIRRTSRRCAR